MGKNHHHPQHGQNQGPRQPNHGNAGVGAVACRQSLKGLAREKGTNAGLLLQRYVPNSATGDRSDPAEKTKLLACAISAANGVGKDVVYSEAFKRRRRVLENSVGLTIVCELKVRGRLIVGLGSENVLETGITLNHVYGVPIIPGSGLKGLAAHYCHTVWGSTDTRFKNPSKEEDEQYAGYLRGQTKDNPGDNFHRLLFGNTDDSGCIIFHDAWWVPGSNGNDSPLVRDVMTPHHPDWLDGRVPPSDFDSPVPVPFLSVTGSFLVAVSWNGPLAKEPDKLQAEKWTQLAMDLLKEALADWGAGGKTSSGYGRLGDSRSKPSLDTPELGRSATTPSTPRKDRTPGMLVDVKIVKVAGKRDKGHRVEEVDDPRIKGILLLNRPTPKGLVPSEGVVLKVEVFNGANPKEIQYQWPKT